MITIKASSFTIENDILCRELVFHPQNGLYTKSLVNKLTGTEFAKAEPGNEFMIRINGEMCFGYQIPEVHEVNGQVVANPFTWALSNAEKFELDGREILKITLTAERYGLQVNCCYQLASLDSGLIKWLEVTAQEAVSLNNFNFEMINAYPGMMTEIELCRDQSKPHYSNCFSVNGEYDRLTYFNRKLDESMLIASNVPGKLRRFLSYPNWSCSALVVGVNTEIGSLIKLIPGEAYCSYQAYLLPAKGAPDSVENNGKWRSFIRQQLPVLPHSEGFMYCTWLPFLTNINESLLIKLVDEAADFGMKYFVIDDGWFTEPNWTVDSVKFPNGLEPVVNHIHKRNMLVGLWFNIGTDYGEAGTFSETNRLDANGDTILLGFSGQRRTRCFASKHSERMADKLIALIEQYGVDYFKLDFSAISSPYGLLPVGCNATNHSGHSCNDDAVPAQYAGLMALRQRVKERYPQVLIDFSFECLGPAEPSIAGLQFSELQHMSNLSNRSVTVDARLIRQSLYFFTAQVPPERILGSLLCLHGDNRQENLELLLTAIAAAPLVAGDLLTISTEIKDELRRIVGQLNEIYNYGEALTEYEVLQPMDAADCQHWDGFVRYNIQGRGFICLFRNQDATEKIVFKCQGLPEGSYLLETGGNRLMNCSNKELAEGVEFTWQDDRSAFITISPNGLIVFR